MGQEEALARLPIGVHRADVSPVEIEQPLFPLYVIGVYVYRFSYPPRYDVATEIATAAMSTGILAQHVDEGCRIEHVHPH